MTPASYSRPGSEKAFPRSPAETPLCPSDRPSPRPGAQGPAAGLRAARGVQPLPGLRPYAPRTRLQGPLDLGPAPSSASLRPIRAHSPGGLCPLAESRRVLPLSSGSGGGLGLPQGLLGNLYR